jgi:hypothetical protein
MTADHPAPRHTTGGQTNDGQTVLPTTKPVCAQEHRAAAVRTKTLTNRLLYMRSSMPLLSPPFLTVDPDHGTHTRPDAVHPHPGRPRITGHHPGVRIDQ